MPTPRCGCSRKSGSKRRANFSSSRRRPGHPPVTIALSRSSLSSFSTMRARRMGPGLRRDDGSSPRLHPLELHAFPVRLPCRDVAGLQAGLALRHLLLRAAQVSHHDARCAARGSAASMISSICSKLSTNSGSFCASDSPAAGRNRSRVSPSGDLRKTVGAGNQALTHSRYRCRRLRPQQRFRAHTGRLGADDAIRTAQGHGQKRLVGKAPAAGPGGCRPSC